MSSRYSSQQHSTVPIRHFLLRLETIVNIKCFVTRFAFSCVLNTRDHCGKENHFHSELALKSHLFQRTEMRRLSFSRQKKRRYSRYGNEVATVRSAGGTKQVAFFQSGHLAARGGLESILEMTKPTGFQTNLCSNYGNNPDEGISLSAI